VGSMRTGSVRGTSWWSTSSTTIRGSARTPSSKRNRRPHHLRGPGMPCPRRGGVRCGEKGREAGAPRRHVPLHGGPRLLDARGVQRLPEVGRGRHRDDEHAGSEASRGRRRSAMSRWPWLRTSTAGTRYTSQ
jgi:hypothetical protein